MNIGASTIFHGVRGSAPASGVDHAEFGGDTPSVEISMGSTRLFIDAGSGLKNARASIPAEGDIDLVLGHYHFDHLIGLPFFEPAWRTDGRFRIFAPKFGDAEPIDILNEFYATPYCPIRLDDFRMRVEIVAYRPGDGWLAAGGAPIATTPVNHPGGAVAIRVSTDAGDIVYASDCELAYELDARRLADFAKGAGLFIADAMNDDANADQRRGWGHSSWRDAINVGEAAGAKAIALFHHDPRRSDIDLVAADAAAHALSPRAFMVRQGLSYRLKSDAERGETASWRCSR